MAGERVKLEVRERTAHGSRESRRLRRSGLIPGVLYGRGAVHPIAIPERDLRKALGGAGGLHTILDVVVQGDGGTHPAVLKEFQRDPVRGKVIHVDLHEVRLDRPIQTAVSVTLLGEPAGVKEGGVLQQVTREVNLEALPMKIPEHLELDVSGLGIGDSLRVADLAAVPDVTFLDDPDETVLAVVLQPTKIEEPEEEPEEGAEVEGLAEGEEAPEGASEASDSGADGSRSADDSSG